MGLPAINDPALAPEIRQFLTFDLANETYGVDILKVQEIRGWQPVREMPEAPRYIKGIMDLRGIILPVMDLRERFGLDPLEYSPSTVVIVLSLSDAGAGKTLLGIVVDAVSDVVDVKPGDLKPAPRVGIPISGDYVRGVLSGEKIAMLLDADKLVAPADLQLIAAGEA